MEHRIRIALTLTLFALVLPGMASEFVTDIEPLGGNDYICRYSIVNSQAAPIEQFILFFDYQLYRNLMIVSDPAVSALRWHEDLLQPEPYWVFDGIYRAVCLGDGIGQFESLSGFAVQFTYLGPGQPPEQPFQVISKTYQTITEQGQTSSSALWVDASRPQTYTPDGSLEMPFHEIADAVAWAGVHPDAYKVNVLPGEYLGFELTADIPDLYLKGFCDADHPAIIDGSRMGSGYAVVFDDNDSRLENFVIINPFGGGIYCTNNTSCQIINNIITLCGIHTDNGLPCVALSASVGNVRLLSNTITSICDSGSVVSLQDHCAFDGEIAYNIIYNYSDSIDPVPVGIFLGSQSFSCDNSMIHHNCIDSINNDCYVEENGIEYCDFELNPTNFSDDPRFVKHPVDILVGAHGISYFDFDFHLRPDSPCIDAGDPAYAPDHADMDSTERLTGPIDIGADEASPAIELIYPAGGETFAAPSTRKIRWNAPGLNGDVQILISLDGGQSWDYLNFSTPNDGEQPFTIPDIASPTCRIAIQPAQYIPGMPRDESGDFTIARPDPTAPADPQWPMQGKSSSRNALADAPGPHIGCVKWTFHTEASVYNSITLGENTVHFTCDDHHLYTLDMDGSLLWSCDLESLPTSEAVIGPRGCIYVATEDGTLWSFSPDGTPRWNYKTNGAILAAPAVTQDGTIYFGSGDGNLYALDAAGTCLWQQSRWQYRYTGQFDDDTISWSHDAISGTALQFCTEATVVTDYDGVMGTNPRAVSAWVRASGPGTIISWGNSEGNNGFKVAIVSPDAPYGEYASRLMLTTGEDVLVGETVITDNQWHHIAVRTNEKTPHWRDLTLIDFQLYIDGVEETATLLYNDPYIYTNTRYDSTVIGPGDPNSSLILDEVAVFRTLSSKTIEKLAGRAVTPAELPFVKSYWPFDEGQGTQIFEQYYKMKTPVSAPPAVDSRGNVYTSFLNCNSLFAYDGRTGEMLWESVLYEYDPEGVYGNMLKGPWIVTSPVIDETREQIYLTCLDDDNLYALDLNTGEIRWQLDMKDHEHEKFPMHCYDESRRFYYFGEAGFTTPTIGPDGTVYVSCEDPYIRAVHPDGTYKWISRIDNTGLVAPDPLYNEGCDWWDVYAFTGYGYGSSQAGGYSITASADGTLYASGPRREIVVLEPDSGQMISRFQLDYPCQETRYWGHWGYLQSPPGSYQLGFPVIGQNGTIYASSTTTYYQDDLPGWGDYYVHDTRTVIAIDPFGCEDARYELTWLTDANADSYVNIADFTSLLENWRHRNRDYANYYFVNYQWPERQPCGPTLPFLPGDFNRDHLVNIYDLYLLTDFWLIGETGGAE